VKTKNQMTETQTILKATELRIGNWIKLYGNACQVTSLSNNSIEVDYASAEHEYTGEGPMIESYEPIPLTPEILQKAGFISGRKYVFQSYEMEAYFELDGDVVKLFCQPNDPHYTDDIAKPIQYVHQLQNLYFAITGVELSIEL
jgi:hypothetical protein